MMSRISRRAFFAWLRASRIIGNADAADFNIHLQGGDSGARAGNFEIHVAVVIFRARDVGHHGVLAAVTDDQAHGDTGARGLERNARVHHGQRAAANRGHRR